MTRALLLGPREREAAHAVALFAARPENHYRPGPGATPPGLIAKHCLRLGVRSDFRCVFSFTVDKDGSLFRHLSVSVPVRGKLPHPAVTEEIARLFGFKGELLGGEWQIATSEEDNCVIVAQRVSGVALAAGKGGR